MICSSSDLLSEHWRATKRKYQPGRSVDQQGDRELLTPVGLANRKSSTEYTVYTDSIEQYKLWNVYGNYYRTFGKKMSMGIHLFGDVELRDNDDVVCDAGIGYFFGFFNKDKKQIINTEVFIDSTISLTKWTKMASPSSGKLRSDCLSLCHCYSSKIKTQFLWLKKQKTNSNRSSGATRSTQKISELFLNSRFNTADIIIPRGTTA